MSTLTPNHWVFLVPDGDSHILYAPIHKMAVRVAREAKPILEPLLRGEVELDVIPEPLAQLFRTNGLLQAPDSWINPSPYGKLDNKITISLTNRCNLRCIYCYAKTGLDFKTAPWEVVHAAIDMLVEQTRESSDKNFAISFHGGGEAFVELKLLRRAVEYARALAEANDFRVRFSAVTNATLITPEIATWLSESGFTHLTVSLDGLQEVNDIQRPTNTKTGSFTDILHGISCLKEVGINFSIRSTVTNIGVSQMSEFTRFVAQEILPPGGTLHFEPMSLCGRAKPGLTTEASRFLDGYTKAKELGEQLGIKVVCTMDSFGNERKRFCGASQATLFCVTPYGRVSACTRVTKDTDAGADLFFYGQYEPEQRIFVLNEENQQKIRKHGKIPAGSCSTCFARWNCQGDCPIARYTYGDHHTQSCQIVRTLLKRSLVQELDKVSSV